MHFGDDVVVPDVAGWRRDRLAQIPNAAFLTFGGDDVARAEPFDAIALALDRWWLPGTEPTR